MSVNAIELNSSNKAISCDLRDRNNSKIKKCLLITSIAIGALVVAETYIHQTSTECNFPLSPISEPPVFNYPLPILTPQQPPIKIGDNFQIDEIRPTNVHSLSDPEFLEKLSHLEKDSIQLTNFAVGSKCLMITQNGKPFALYQPNSQQHDIGSYAAMLIDQDRFFNVPSVADIDLGFRTDEYLQGGLATEYIEKDHRIKRHIGTDVLLTNNKQVKISPLSVQKLAVLDFLIQNQDRHDGNMLLRYNEEENSVDIIPIDHNEGMPQVNFDLYDSPDELEKNFNSITFIQSLAFNPYLSYYENLEIPIHQDLIEWIQNFDPEQSLPSLGQLTGFNRDQLNAAKMRALILKTGTRLGLNIKQMYDYSKKNMPQVAKEALKLTHEALEVKYGNGCYFFAQEQEMKDLFFKYSEILATAQLEKSSPILDSIPSLKKQLFQEALFQKSREIREKLHPNSYLQSVCQMFKGFFS